MSKPADYYFRNTPADYLPSCFTCSRFTGCDGPNQITAIFKEVFQDARRGLHIMGLEYDKHEISTKAIDFLEGILDEAAKSMGVHLPEGDEKKLINTLRTLEWISQEQEKEEKE